MFATRATTASSITAVPRDASRPATWSIRRMPRSRTSTTTAARRTSISRRLLERPDLDAVSIATPDHVHAVATMAAIRKGKHVYCQKPLTHTVREARAVTEAAARHGVVTQMGHQLHATDKLKRLVELVQAGAVGSIRQIHCWAGAAMGGKQTPVETPPVPAGFDWDRWIGPAPYRAYHPDYAPFTWRYWRDFGTGTLGDFGCHILDPAMWAVGLPDRMTIEASSTAGSDDCYAIGNTVRYRFTPPGADSEITVTWYDGGLKPFRPAELPTDVELPGSGGLYVGDEGTILAPHGGEAQVFPKRGNATPEVPAETLPRGESHYEEWVRACRGGAPPLSNFSYAGPLTEMVLLGNVALVDGQAAAVGQRPIRGAERCRGPGATASALPGGVVRHARVADGPGLMRVLLRFA